MKSDNPETSHETFLFALKTELYHSFFWSKIMVRITIKYRAKISIHAKVRLANKKKQLKTNFL
jgi:hypothetical protein